MFRRLRCDDVLLIFARTSSSHGDCATCRASDTTTSAMIETAQKASTTPLLTSQQLYPMITVRSAHCRRHKYYFTASSLQEGSQLFTATLKERVVLQKFYQDMTRHWQ